MGSRRSAVLGELEVRVTRDGKASLAWDPSSEPELEDPPEWSPAVVMAEVDGAFLLRFDLPDVDPRDLRVQMVGYAVRVHGCRRRLVPPGRSGVYCSEVPSGRFSSESDSCALSTGCSASSSMRSNATSA